jgi:transposase
MKKDRFKIKDLFRQDKVGKLTPEQMARVDYIKAKAYELKEALKTEYDIKEKLNPDNSCLEISLQKLEESVMWATKAYTNTNIEVENE